MPVTEEALLEAGVEPWVHLPLWLPADVARTAWDVDTSRARALGLPAARCGVGGRHLGLAADARAAAGAGGSSAPGLPPELEATLLATS